MTTFVLTANIANGEHQKAFEGLTEALTYGKHLQRQPTTISFRIERAEASGFVLEKQWTRRGGRMLGMNFWRVEKKLREAMFFFDRMKEQEQLPVGHRAPFDYYHSAFLSAAKSVRELLSYEQGQDQNSSAVYKAWREAWYNRLAPATKSLIDFMSCERNAEVHTVGSRRRAEKGERRMRGDTYIVPDYYVYIDGTDRQATDACAEYLRLLSQLVNEFKAAYPQP